MNPYDTPKTKYYSPKSGSSLRGGRRCRVCGGASSKKDSLLRPKPSILMVIFFGWLYLLIRGAFAMRTEQCSDCGESNQFKSAGSWVALSVLIFLVFCVVAAVLD